jgi:Glycine-zipper domain
MRKLLLIAAVALPAAACADLNPTQQRALTGTVGGAGVGAVAGAIGGNAGLGAAVGAGAGLLGGLVFDQHRRAEDRAFQQGYSPGRRGAPPNPPS